MVDAVAFHLGERVIQDSTGLAQVVLKRSEDPRSFFDHTRLIRVDKPNLQALTGCADAYEVTGEHDRGISTSALVRLDAGCSHSEYSCIPPMGCKTRLFRPEWCIQGDVRSRNLRLP